MLELATDTTFDVVAEGSCCLLGAVAFGLFVAAVDAAALDDLFLLPFVTSANADRLRVPAKVVPVACEMHVACDGPHRVECWGCCVR